MTKTYNIPQAAAQLGVSTDVVRGAIRAKRLRAVNIGVKGREYWRINWEDLQAFAATLPTNADRGNK